ncbi:MAG: RnfABCDGE type electron transport complex subunit G [Clostridiales bacterium]|jgi:RnfABCDGE-type electron transport complex G subunit|nr:RnfABCDGE type electron transport complex subunit G [Clostridiales bacterium]
MFRPAIVLFAICAIITCALAATYAQTKDAIAAGEAQIANEIRSEVLPADEFEAIEPGANGASGSDVADGAGNAGGANGSGSAGGSEAGGGESGEPGANAYPRVAELYRGVSGGRTLGYVATVLSKGYGGDIAVIVGIGADGKITGVRVASHSETPGLGANSTNPDFYSQYDQKDIRREISVAKASPGDNDIAAISGATITSNAVNTAVKAAIEAAIGLMD